MYEIVQDFRLVARHQMAGVSDQHLREVSGRFYVAGQLVVYVPRFSDRALVVGPVRALHARIQVHGQRVRHHQVHLAVVNQNRILSHQLFQVRFHRGHEVRYHFVVHHAQAGELDVADVQSPAALRRLQHVYVADVADGFSRIPRDFVAVDDVVQTWESCLLDERTHYTAPSLKRNICFFDACGWGWGKPIFVRIQIVSEQTCVVFQIKYPEYLLNTLYQMYFISKEKKNFF